MLKDYLPKKGLLFREFRAQNPLIWAAHTRTLNMFCTLLSVWGCCGMTKMLALQKLQNRAARIATKRRFDTPAMALTHNLN